MTNWRRKHRSEIGLLYRDLYSLEDTAKLESNTKPESKRARKLVAETRDKINNKLEKCENH